jgi:hypothetical protein
VLSRKGLCDELIARPEESYRLRCVVVCDLETSLMWRPWPTGGCRAKNKQFTCYVYKLSHLVAFKDENFTNEEAHNLRRTVCSVCVNETFSIRHILQAHFIITHIPF